MSTLLSLAWRLLPHVIAIVAVALVVRFTYSRGVSDERERRVAEVAQLTAHHRRDLAAIDSANKGELARLTKEARDKEADNHLAMAELDKTHFKELQNAKTEARRTIDGLRTGAVRVRDKYTCAGTGDGSSAGGVPQAGTSTSVGDGAAGRGFGAEDAAEVFAAADEGDGWAGQLRACQAIVSRDREQQ